MRRALAGDAAAIAVSLRPLNESLFHKAGLLEKHDLRLRAKNGREKKIQLQEPFLWV